MGWDFLTIFGHVRCIRADNGPSFDSSEFREFCKRLNIRLTFTSIYNPAANRAERPHSQLNRALDLCEKEGVKFTSEDLIRFSWTNNLLPKRITKKSPVEILFGGTPSGILDDDLDEENHVTNGNQVEKEVSDSAPCHPPSI